MPVKQAISAPSFIRRPTADQSGETREKIRKTLSGSIRKIEKKNITLDTHETHIRVSLGIDKVDRALGGDTKNNRGLIANALHEVRVESAFAAAAGAGFSLCLGMTIARKLLTRHQTGQTNPETPIPSAFSPPVFSPPVFWICDPFTCHEYGDFYGPGLAFFGLPREKLIRLHPETIKDALWAAGEIAATKNAATFCLMEIRGHPKEFDLTTSRRLMLRAQTSKTPIIILRQSSEEEASAAATRWLVRPAASSRITGRHTNPLMRQFIGPPCFNVRLEKCRGTNANQMTPWKMEWNVNDQCLTLASTKTLSGTASGKIFSTVGTADKNNSGPVCPDTEKIRVKAHI